MRQLSGCVIVVMCLLVSASTAQAGSFGRLFPGLPPLNQQTNQQIADLAQTQLDPNLDTENNCAPGATDTAQCVGSGFTYFGQFLDHDLTLDTSPSPLSPVDPTTLTNSRTLALDLDSVYGGGPQFFTPDGKRFLLQEPNVNGVVDLPRSLTGQALINEGRNDENQVISQIELAVMRGHNRLVDAGMTFAQARKAMTVAYQHAVTDDFLPHLLDGNVKTPADLKPVQKLIALTPGTTAVEFSVAAYRFGHSQVRRAYEVTDTSGKVQVFSLTAPDLRGGQQLTPARVIDWDNFFSDIKDEDEPSDVLNGTPNPAAHFNIGRKIDPLISSSLFVLPIPGAEAAGSNVLAFRNLIRAKFYDMPSGQSVAQAMGITPIPAATFGLAPEWNNGTPLWYYILGEASRLRNGERLGPVGSAIVGGTFHAVLFKDSGSILRGNKNTAVDARIAGPDGRMTVSDLVLFGS